MTHVITTAEELGSLPVGTRFRDRLGDIGEIVIEPGRVQYPEMVILSTAYVSKHYLPATILHNPSATVENPSVWHKSARLVYDTLQVYADECETRGVPKSEVSPLRHAARLAQQVLDGHASAADERIGSSTGGLCQMHNGHSRRVGARCTCEVEPTPLERAADSFDISTSTNARLTQMTIQLMRAWAKADPMSSVAQHPASFIATFVDMARGALSDTSSQDAVRVRDVTSEDDGMENTSTPGTVTTSVSSEVDEATSAAQVIRRPGRAGCVSLDVRGLSSQRKALVALRCDMESAVTDAVNSLGEVVVHDDPHTDEVRSTVTLDPDKLLESVWDNLRSSASFAAFASVVTR